MELEFKLNDARIGGLCLFDYGWLEVEIDVPETTAIESKLEISASRTWQPSVANPNSGDDRHLSIAVCKIEIR
jgi:hypothetical protein